MLIRVFWPTGPIGGNFGDMITKFLLDKEGISYQYCTSSASGKLLGCGSIIQFSQPGDTIIGTGIIRFTDDIAYNLKVIALRGKITRAKVKDRGNKADVPLGDLGLLLPYYYSAEANRKPLYRVGIVPHYKDLDIVKRCSLPDNWCIISPLLRDNHHDITEIITKITSCQCIFSSSLHGLVAAYAYGIPALWTRFSAKLIGGHAKFADFYSGVGQETYYGEEIISPGFLIDNGNQFIERAQDQHATLTKYDRQALSCVWDAWCKEVKKG